MIKIAPSLLSADFTRLGEDISSVSSADLLHFDVMDGVFVPNISIGFPVLESVRKFTDMPLDVHLMISSPHRYVREFAEKGADIIVFHLEAETHENILSAISEIKSLGKKAGLSLKPGTASGAIVPYLPLLDVVLVMTVEPGFGGQSFMAGQLAKVGEIKAELERIRCSCEIEIDGGINPETARLCVAAGADILVAGNDIFKSEDRARRISELRG